VRVIQRLRVERQTSAAAKLPQAPRRRAISVFSPPIPIGVTRQSQRFFSRCYLP